MSARGGRNRMEFSVEQIKAMSGPASHASLARQFGCSDMPIRRWRRANGWAAPAKVPAAAGGRPVVADVEAGPSEVERLRDEVTRLRAEQRKTGKLVLIEHRILDAIVEARNSVEPFVPQRVTIPKPHAHRTTPHEMLLLASDWHAGAVVDPAQVDHINEFNWDILQQRVASVRDGVISFAALTPNLTRLIIGWLGDQINGIIHEELVATNEFPVAEQTVLCGELMGQLVTELASALPHVHCAGVAGNHARTKPGHASTNVFDSWDWVAYHIAKQATRHLPNVTWDLPKAGSHIIDVAGLRGLLFHGDGIKSSMVGFPAGGVKRRSNAKQAQYARRRSHIDFLCCGHFHDPQIMGIGEVYVNGSLMGINPFGDKNYGDGADPAQLLVTFDAKRSRMTNTAYVTPR